MQNQAAGFAFGWKKINALEGINGIQWHSWFDHLGDGARLGLRKYNDAEYQGEAKPVWMTYQKAGTDAENEYFEQYLQRIVLIAGKDHSEDSIMFIYLGLYC